MIPALPAPVIADDLYEQLLRQLLDGPVERRLQVFVEACRAGYGGMTILDRACPDDRGRPYVITFTDLWSHLRRTDSRSRITRRGRRLHTPDNTEWGSAEDIDGYGPAMRGSR